MKTNRNFLSAADRADLVAIARDGLEENRISRRANAILLLDRGWSFAAIAEALFIDDSTIRIWVKEFQEGGVEALVLFDLKGGTGRLSPLQIDELRAWATRVLPTSTTEIGQFILERFGFDYGRSGLIKLMNRIGFDWKKPESVPDRIDAETQQKFIDAPLAAARTALRASRGVRARPAEPARRDRPGDRTDPHHGCPDRRRGKHDRPVRGAGARQFDDEPHPRLPRQRPLPPRPGRPGLAATAREADRPAFVPSYCPHLNPIERLWKVMHENVTHNRCYAKFRDFAEAVLGFLRETVPSRFDEFSSSITDNFRVINPKDFRILA